jgi:hypothetical protein
MAVYRGKFTPGVHFYVIEQTCSQVTQHAYCMRLCRLYSGLRFALIQAPLARFVSTAANEGVETLFSSLEYTKDWGPGRTTVVASVVVGLWRMLLMRKYRARMRYVILCTLACLLTTILIHVRVAIDTIKTVLQVDSVEGFRSLMRRVNAGKISVLYEGSYANAISAIVGHYPWVSVLCAPVAFSCRDAPFSSIVPAFPFEVLHVQYVVDKRLGEEYYPLAVASECWNWSCR